MTSSERDITSLLDILNSCKLIKDWTVGQERKEIFRNPLLSRAVIYEIAKIGEATRRITEGFKKQHTHIPWDEMKGMRNHLIHDYDDIIEDNVWEVITIDIDALIVKIEPLVPPPNDYE